MDPWGFVERETGVSSALDFFFGCGSSTVRLLCFDRTGTGTVVLDGGFGMADNGRGSGCGSMTESVLIGNMGEARVVQESAGGWQWCGGTEWDRWDEKAVMGRR